MRRTLTPADSALVALLAAGGDARPVAVVIAEDVYADLRQRGHVACFRDWFSTSSESSSASASGSPRMARAAEVPAAVKTSYGVRLKGFR